MSHPSETEWLAHFHEQARDIMKLCDELIDRAERELPNLASRPDKRRLYLAACVEHKAGWFALASLTKPPSIRAPAANSN